MERSPTPHRTRDQGGAPLHGDARQAELPLEVLEVPEDAPPGDAASSATDPQREHERPIGFALTARARRAVAPASLPELSVVTDRARGDGNRIDGDRVDGALDEPGDTRPARARALRRAGVPVSEIARQLRTDTLAVTAWVGERASRGRQGAQAGDTATAMEAVGEGAPSGHDGAAPAGDADIAHHLARAAAAEVARRRLEADGGFALGVGILASLAAVDEHAVTLTGGPAALHARALDLLATEQPEARRRARVIARVGPQVAGDLVRHRTATALGLDPGQVSWTRQRGVAAADGVELLVRIADPSLAATVAGWVDAALDPAPVAVAAWEA